MPVVFYKQLIVQRILFYLSLTNFWQLTIIIILLCSLVPRLPAFQSATLNSWEQGLGMRLIICTCTSISSKLLLLPVLHYYYLILHCIPSSELWAGLVNYMVHDGNVPILDTCGEGIDLAHCSPVITDGELSAQHVTDCLGDSWVHLFSEHTDSHQLTASTGTVI